PNTGYNFSFNNGRPQMVSRFYTPGTYLNSDVINPLWPGIRQYLSQIAQDPEALKQLPPPFNVLTPAQAQIIVGILPQQLTAGQIPGIFKRLDLVAAQTGSSDPFVPVEVSSVQNIKPIKPTIHNNFELGYKAIISQKLLVTVDVYHTKIRDFVGPLKVETPNVFANRDSLSNALAAQLAADPQAVATLQQFGLTPQIFAGVFASFLQGIPLGIISPQELKNGAEVMQTYRNFGQVSLNGMDISLSFFASPKWTFSGNYSFVTKHGLNIFKRPNRVFVRNLDGIANLALNAPGNKAALSIQYRAPERGYDVELRGRYVDGFPMESGAYAGEIQTYTIFDLNFGYDLPFSKNTRFALNVQNMFDKKHLEFIGAPILGRLIMTRLTQSLDADVDRVQATQSELPFKYEINAGLAIPTGELADTHEMGFEFGGSGYVATNNPYIMAVLGASYTTFPGKTNSGAGLTLPSFNPFKVFLGTQFGREKGFYFLPAATANFEEDFSRFGLDIGAGFLLPIGAGNTKLDLGTKFSMINLLGKENGEKTVNALRLGVGVAF
ncbi:MAG: TonB-dependent receptor domain-containing protein, partial [bacterium]